MARGGGAVGAVFALGLALLVGVVAGDQVLAERSLLHERPPGGSPVYVLRAAAVAAASAALAWAGRQVAVRSLEERTMPARSAHDAWPAAVVGMAASLAAAVMVILAPDQLTGLAEEDELVEWLSAILTFAAAGLVTTALVVRRRQGTATTGGSLGTVALVSVAGACLLLGLEEVSWFERLLDLDPPDFLDDRNQPELNFHNAATDLTENVYYVGGFGFTVGLPYLLADRRLPGRCSGLERLVPSPVVLYGSVYAGAIVFEMWEIIPIQMVFWMSLFITATERRVPELGRAASAVLVVTVVIFLAMGANMGRSWDDTEVRELIIPYGFLLYGITLLGALRAPDPDPDPETSRLAARS